MRWTSTTGADYGIFGGPVLFEIYTQLFLRDIFLELTVCEMETKMRIPQSTNNILTFWNFWDFSYGFNSATDVSDLEDELKEHKDR